MKLMAERSRIQSVCLPHKIISDIVDLQLDQKHDISI